MTKIPVYSGSPARNAPYTPAVSVGNLVFVSGQVPMNHETRELITDDFEAAVRQCIHNIESILKAAGSDLNHCVKVVVFLADMNNFDRLNAVYSQYFGDIKPARSCIQVARLPLDAIVEIEAIAEIS